MLKDDGRKSVDIPSIFPGERHRGQADGRRGRRGVGDRRRKGGKEPIKVSLWQRSPPADALYLEGKKAAGTGCQFGWQ